MSLKPSQKALDYAYSILPPSDMLYGNYLPEINKEELNAALRAAFREDIKVENNALWEELLIQLEQPHLYSTYSLHTILRLKEAVRNFLKLT